VKVIDPFCDLIPTRLSLRMDPDDVNSL